MRVLAMTHGSDLPESHMLMGLARSGVELEVMMNPKSPHYDRMVEAGLPVEPWLCKGRLDRASIRHLRKKFRASPPDLVHSLYNRALGNALWASRGLPIRHVAYRGRQGNVSRWDPAARITYFHPRLDRIICVSNGVKDSLLAARMPADRLITIYKGHDPAWYRTTGPKPDLSEFGIPDDAFVVGCAANLRGSKGAEVLLAAVHELIRMPEVHFLLMGEVRDDHVKRLAADPKIAGQLHLAGFRTDARELLGACNLCVMSSRTEGLPKGVIEAMVQGIPAVVTRVGGMPELVEDGVSGLVVPPGDPVALAGAIGELAADPRRCLGMGEQARRRIVEQFNTETTVEQTLALYREILEMPRI